MKTHFVKSTVSMPRAVFKIYNDILQQNYADERQFWVVQMAKHDRKATEA